MQAKALEATTQDLYDLDFFEWTAHNAQLLRAGRFHEADIQHIAEEIEDMGTSERRQLESRLEVLLTHMLKWQAQPSRRGPSWMATIRVQRIRVAKLLRKMPSLRNTLQEAVHEAYEVSVVLAASQTRLSEDTLPQRCPFTVEQLLDPAFSP